MKKILFVDDEYDLIEEWKNYILNESLYEIFLAESAQKAINIIKSANIDVLVTDIRMEPGIDGIELMKYSLHHNNKIQCIVITAYGDVETAVNAMKSGAVNFLTKPVSVEILICAINECIEKQELKLFVEKELPSKILSRSFFYYQLSNPGKSATEFAKDINEFYCAEIWPINKSPDRTDRSKKIENYLTGKIGKRDKGIEILQSVNYVLETCSLIPDDKNDLRQLYYELKDLKK